ncbi:MAG: hypothetical protein OFPII_10350 [Osedax symbiont Rs1]|nr:MAG: hypothetical protein OFPII_10350 [Osedax symbiont Rs1]
MAQVRSDLGFVRGSSCKVLTARLDYLSIPNRNQYYKYYSF